MGKNPWEDPDPDVAALRASMRAKSPTRWGRLVIGLLIVAGVTFIAAYYIPLFRAHDKLRAEFQTLSERRRVLDENLASKERELKKLESDKTALQAQVDERAQADEAKQAELEKLRVAVSSKIRAFETKRLAASSIAGDRVRISLANRLVFTPNTVTITKQAGSVLCDIAGAVDKGTPLRVVSVTSADEAASPLAAKYASRRELSAARAAVVADRLEETCGVPSARVEPIGWLEGGDAKAWGVGLPATAIEFSLPKK
ncbi:MAG TPA: hypothetical protein VFU02_21080 [Polyangiaceae bacterium]|nr:hypothetical protein [Polyangiaceae bacterium]